MQKLLNICVWLKNNPRNGSEWGGGACRIQFIVLYATYTNLYAFIIEIASDYQQQQENDRRRCVRFSALSELLLYVFIEVCRTLRWE